MFVLNLPEFKPKIQKVKGILYIFDPTRKKYLLLTPEEWVRQSLVAYLVHSRQYPQSLISIERGLKYEKRQKRSDIVVYDRMGQAFLLIECKAMYIPMDQKVLEQAAQYNHVLQAPYLAVTNGQDCLAYATDWQNQEMQILDSLPAYPSM